MTKIKKDDGNDISDKNYIAVDKNVEKIQK